MSEPEKPRPKTFAREAPSIQTNITPPTTESSIEAGVKQCSGAGGPSLLTLYTTEAEASKRRTKLEKEVADPHGGETFLKLLKEEKK